VKHIGSILILGLLVMVMVAGSVQATYVTSIQLGFMSGDYLFKDNAFRLLDADGSSPVSPANGFMKTYGATDFGYDLVDATLTMGSQSQLNLDDSGPGGSFNPELAKGYFDAGATISISGKIEKRGPNPGDPSTEIFDGLILEAYISTDDFLAQERDFPVQLANQVKSNHAMVVTAGELYSGTVGKLTDLILLDYTAKYDTMNCQQWDGLGWVDVKDFQSNIIVGAGSRVHFDAVPEPASLVLLGLGSLLIRRKKKN